jgi:hypothetical protein
VPGAGQDLRRQGLRRDRGLDAGLPDIFSNQKSKFGLILEYLETKDVGKFKGHLVYFTATAYFYGNLVYFVVILVHFFQF